MKYRVPPFWPTYIGERGTIFAKAYGIKVRCYWELFGGTCQELGELFALLHKVTSHWLHTNSIKSDVIGNKLRTWWTSLGTWKNTLLGKWRETKVTKFQEKSTCAGLAQENGFSPANYGQFAEAGKKTQQNCAPAREEYNEYDLSADPCFWSANHNDWSSWSAISSSHLFDAIPVSVLWVGLQKSK